MEAVVEKMSDEVTGVPVRTVKSFMTKTPSVFTGKILRRMYYKLFYYFRLTIINDVKPLLR